MSDVESMSCTACGAHACRDSRYGSTRSLDAVDRADPEVGRRAVGERHRHGRADAPAVVLGRRLEHARARRRRAPRPSLDCTSRSSTRPTAAGSTTVSASVSSVDERRPPAQPDRVADLGQRGRRRSPAAGLSPPLPKSPEPMTRSPRERLRHGLVDRRLERRREHGEQRHHADADHQRRRGARRPPRVAHRVLAREPADDATQPRQRERRARWPTGRATTGPNTTSPTMVISAPSPATGSDVVAATDHRREHDRDADRRSARHRATARTTDAPVRSTATSRSAASGATRDARSAGATAATRVTTTPTTNDVTTVPVVNSSPPAGQREPEGVEQPLSSAAIPRPPTTPAADASTPITTASRTTDPSTWPPARTERPQQRGLTGALGDDDRERVVDAERRRPAARCRRRRPGTSQHVEEVAVDVVDVLGRELGAGDRLDVVGQLGPQVCARARPARHRARPGR